MNTLLVRHPAPHPRESLSGYILRLSELNGYQTPWSIFTLAGMKENERRTSGLRVDKLASVINRPVNELRSLGYAHPTSPRACRLLDHDLIPFELSVLRPKLCPECVKTKGFIEAHWNLNIMTACPVHGAECVSVCPQCGVEPGIYRPGLLECQCGSSLEMPTGLAVSAAHRDLLDVVRRIVLRLEPMDTCASGIPAQNLARFDLRQILVLIRVLGRLTTTANTRPKIDQHAEIVSRAAVLLSDWPNNLQGFLATTAELPTARMSFARGAFGSIYSAIMKSRILTHNKIEFIRNVFADYAQTQWDRDSFRRRGSSPSENPSKRQRISRQKFAKQLGIHIKTLDKLIEEGQVPSATVTVGGQSRTLCIASANTIAPVTSGNVLWLRKAADAIGIPVEILKLLKKSGEFPSKHYPRTKSGFHENDVRDFIQNIVANARPAVSCNKGIITFNTAMQRLKRDRSWQFRFVRAVINGDISIEARNGKNLATLLINEDEYSRYIDSVISPLYGASVGIEQAAHILHCDPRTVSCLIRANHLEAQVFPIGIRVSVTSLDHFSGAYLSLVELAKRHGTSSRALVSKCFKLKIELLTTANGRPQAFIAKDNVPQLYPGESTCTAA